MADAGNRGHAQSFSMARVARNVSLLLQCASLGGDAQPQTRIRFASNRFDGSSKRGHVHLPQICGWRLELDIASSMLQMDADLAKLPSEDKLVAFHWSKPGDPQSQSEPCFANITRSNIVGPEWQNTLAFEMDRECEVCVPGGDWRQRKGASGRAN